MARTFRTFDNQHMSQLCGWSRKTTRDNRHVRTRADVLVTNDGISETTYRCSVKYTARKARRAEDTRAAREVY